ncbi:hypothetical protein [Amycolatopsis sp. FDAARGOS 1241]|uniref:hypothetical protein n=1 Tax=Amycolatopsis sp. FDAARGOS 1241 TaxID=2778070 RepID=UPI00194DE53E|nr:hypothetical protein [Amycolatopsis sp. FDAARGOS 1241]QRP48952.1 hypothetical protein I6J71_14770 [Amycolatopsis sp. FDAARGOS 1241]
MTTIWRWTAALAATLGAISLTTAAPAFAAETAKVAPAEAAPSCFSVRQWEDLKITGFRSYAEVKNNCSRAYRVRVIWKLDFDGSCKSVLPGTGFTEWRQGKMPSVDEIRLC